jgi:hypothetical protein
MSKKARMMRARMARFGFMGDEDEDGEQDPEDGDGEAFPEGFPEGGGEEDKVMIALLSEFCIHRYTNEDQVTWSAASKSISRLQQRLTHNDVAGGW